MKELSVLVIPQKSNEERINECFSQQTQENCTNQKLSNQLPHSAHYSAKLEIHKCTKITIWHT